MDWTRSSSAPTSFCCWYSCTAAARASAGSDGEEIMDESYLDGGAPGAALSLARDLIARLIPSGNADLLVAGLLAERASPEGSRPRGVASDPPRDSSRDPASYEVQRVRRLLMLGE